ncbi:Alpha/Beta hydrolase protein [Epithele typhae]|uniref:Alpha/Beta hydrolase protein n=1 Tax=Epithele typhae TaxID=378194 RepID=UPI002007CB1B|nr:Alpha/Beta hydrolase protein [Epithele typhae]KAH9914172.1 Alpha/Beta hydrolase protein [Epithele typhae]
MADRQSSEKTPARLAQRGLARRTLVVGGLAVDVYNHSHPPAAAVAEREVAVAFLLHGRNGSARRMEEFVVGIVEEVQRLRLREGGGLDLFVVAFDHRNHGRRLVDARANMGWSEDAEKDNPRHAIDMYSILTGTAADVSYLIDFLPAYLFPHGERAVARWMCVGKSLGGHSAWHVLKNDPRVRIGVPVIGCPDYLALVTKRAKAHKLALAPPQLPASLRARIAADDPAAAPYAAAGPENPFLGKKILVLAGKEDRVVPWSAGRAVVEALCVGEGGVKEVLVEEGVGHEFSERMVREAARFLWEHGLKAGERG